VPIVTINTQSVPVARSGAALPRVAAPWANPSGAGVRSALPQNSGPVLGTTPADFVTPRLSAVMAQTWAIAAAGFRVDVRKQYVHKTRVNAGGDGAAGPHPEREPA
jgi:hypothetical protein